MPDKDGTVTDAELKARLERQRTRRDELRKERKRINERLDDVGETVRRTLERIKNRRVKGGDVAARWALSKRGVTESPPSSNRGPQIDVWTRYTGYAPPVFWCGCFAAYAVCHEGAAKIPTRVRLGYHLYIVQDAQARRNGLRAVPVADAKPGDLVAYSFAHIGVIVGPTTGGMVHTVEGNTSSASGSQNNGGGVFERKRPVSDVLVIARPDYS